MFESPVALAHCRDEEYKTLHRRGFVEETDVLLAQALQIAAQPRQVGAVAARDDDIVRHAARAKACESEFAHLHRVVDQLVVVRSDIAAESERAGAFSRHRRSDAPIAVARAPGPQDLELARRTFVPERPQEHASAVEKSVPGIEVRAAHREVPRVYLVAHAERPGDRLRAPGVLVDLLESHRAVTAPGIYGNDVTREVPNHVAAGGPRREREPLPRRIGVFDHAGYAIEVRFGPRRDDRVTDGRRHLGASASVRDPKARRYRVRPRDRRPRAISPIRGVA